MYCCLITQESPCFSCGECQTVYWSINSDYDVNSGDDESYACDWDNPVMVIDGNGKNVIGNVSIDDEIENELGLN